MGASLAFISYGVCTKPFVIEIFPDKSMNLNYNIRLYDIIKLLFEKTIETIIILGGILAGCMGILWAGEIWQKTSTGAVTQYRLTTNNAIRMVVAYFIIALNISVWMSIPLYDRMIKLIEVLNITS